MREGGLHFMTRKLSLRILWCVAFGICYMFAYVSRSSRFCLLSYFAHTIKQYPGGEIKSKCGTHLGHNLPDEPGVNRCVEWRLILGRAHCYLCYNHCENIFYGDLAQAQCSFGRHTTSFESSWRCWEPDLHITTTIVIVSISCASPADLCQPQANRKWWWCTNATYVDRSDKRRQMPSCPRWGGQANKLILVILNLDCPVHEMIA